MFEWGITVIMTFQFEKRDLPHFVFCSCEM